MIRRPSSPAMTRVRGRFERLYGPEADRCLERFGMMIGRYGLAGAPASPPPRWSEKDAVLIAYGDAVQAPGEKPLATLKRFVDGRFHGAIGAIHVLPFFPYSSDDGFSVIHFRQVNPALGGWPEIRALGEKFGLMFDLVLNHVSRKSGWFQDYLLGIAPGRRYFVEADPRADLSAVVRPRTSPLLTRVMTRGGERHVWTTFSSDQVDLDFANPDVLFEILDILMLYASTGARIIRLDAIAYLWKKPGTTCIHLPETHEVVKLIRDVLDIMAPGVILVTETNVPQDENLSYFGAGDEAHMVYQFPLPPLLLHALVNGHARHLTAWAAALPAPPPGCTVLNFTASHDGIGLRPLQGLVPAEEIAKLAEVARAQGGEVSFKKNSDGSESAYELNVTYFDALGTPGQADDVLQVARFLCSQTIPMVLRGIPAFYFNSLVAATNDAEQAKRTGMARSLNRKKWTLDELDARLAHAGSATARVFAECTRRLRLRAAHPAFHPDAAQEVLDLDPRVFAVRRTAPSGGEAVTALANVSLETVALPLDRLPPAADVKDLLGGSGLECGNECRLGPYEAAWLTS